MRLGRFKKGREKFYGLVENGSVIPINGSPFDKEELKLTDDFIPLYEVSFLSPVKPSKVIAVGLNYRDHAKELGMKILDEPIIFLKPSTSVIGHEEEIIYPSQVSQLDYEAELSLVVGRECRNVSLDEAKEFIYGFTCGNDVTARDLQKKDGQWTRAKSFDTFAPLGPWVETELDLEGIEIKLFLNGELKQSSNSSQMIFSPFYLLSFVSHIMTLYPGDVIMTGTPPGVGPMKPGDKVEVVIESIGTLRNTVVEEESKVGK
jgi:2-keto-4-pentenoate hydratase/2-oxohepta-3-ene-1,7-dioic acid hydratase in catechol pathway